MTVTEAKARFQAAQARLKALPVDLTSSTWRAAWNAVGQAGVDLRWVQTQATVRRCNCGEPEDGGAFGWFDAPDGLVCLACGAKPLS